jgi:hypothetical protein
MLVLFPEYMDLLVVEQQQVLVLVYKRMVDMLKVVMVLNKQQHLVVVEVERALKKKIKKIDLQKKIQKYLSRCRCKWIIIIRFLLI